MSTLSSLFATWRAAESPAVDVTRAHWPELERVLRAAAALRPFAETSSTAATALADVLAARRIVTCTPLRPSHELTGLERLTGKLERFLTDRPDHSLCQQLEPLVAALLDLFVTDSPIAGAVAGVLCEYGAASDGTPEAVLVVPRRRWVPAVQAWLTTEEFDCVDAACLSDLRTRLVTHRAAVLVGHPATAFSSTFHSPEVAVRESGWVLTAPAAMQVRVVLPADAPALPVDEAWLLTATAHPQLRVRDDGPAHAAATSPDLTFAGEPSAPVRWTRPPPAPVSEEETVAVEVQLASGHAVFFHPELGPRPHVVAVDQETGAVALSATPLSAVTRGVVLAVRVGAAPHDQVVARADGWLQQQRGWSREKIAQVRGYAAELKVALRSALARTDYHTLHRRLTRTLSDEYAHVLLHNPLDELYIAPQRHAGFDALIEAIGAQHLSDHFDELATVRTAHQQAGEAIRRDLLALLRDEHWVADLDDDGWVVLHAGELGALLLAVVTARLNELVPVARTWLGGLVDSSGRRVTTLSAKEGM